MTQWSDQLLYLRDYRHSELNPWLRMTGCCRATDDLLTIPQSPPASPTSSSWPTWLP